MADVHTPEQRSFNMSRIRGRDTKPEIVVRSLLHRMGYRFRLHVRGLPGSPDIVLPRFRSVIFVHGCFWHRHNCRRGRVRPQTNAEFWEQKLQANAERDRRNRRRLRNAGWRVMTVWECSIRRSPEVTSERLKAFLNEASET